MKRFLCRLFGHRRRWTGGLLSPRVCFCRRCHRIVDVEVLN